MQRVEKVKGIVLHTIKYGESSIIAYVYTNLHGRKTYLFRNVRTVASRRRNPVIQPLFLLDIETCHSRKLGGMSTAKEVRPSVNLQSIPFDVRKNAIALFLGEVLYKLVREEEDNPALFDFMYHHILWLDSIQESISHFHLYFLVQLARHLGFSPRSNYNDLNSYFDMQNGLFVSQKDHHALCLPKQESAYLAQLAQCGIEDLFKLNILRTQRNTLLRMLLNYYSTHLGMENPIHSLDVLEEVFSP
ncbi:MAG: DNA repair protein RecO [Bacteroidales bacterium]